MSTLDKRTAASKAIGLLNLNGWTADKVERRVGRISRDFLGFIDIMAFKLDAENGGTLALQVTSSNARLMREHEEKMLANKHLIGCLQAGWRVELWGIGRKQDKAGRYMKARTFIFEDQNLRVIDGSLIVDV